VKDGGNAACWIALNPAGTYAYVVDNLGGTHTTGGISVFEINSNGQVADLAADVISLGPGAADVAITPDGANLYYVVPGELSGGASVVNAFTVNSNGSLTQITGLTSGLPTTVEGMASR
jgi:DNA-binding beta-propeller fold protein YncE